MTLQEVMLYLQIHYREGIIVVSSLVIAVYLLFSIRLLFTARRLGMKVWVLAFVPGVNIIVWLSKCIKSHTQKKTELSKEVDF